MTPWDVERRGTLTYWVGYEVREFTGWVMRSKDGKGVAVRKIRGRNRWHLCRSRDVINFRAEEKGGAS